MAPQAWGAGPPPHQPERKPRWFSMEMTPWGFAREGSLGLNKGKTAGRGGGTGKEKLLPEGTDLCVHFDPALNFICCNHILFTAPLSERCSKPDGSRDPSHPHHSLPTTQATGFRARCAVASCSRVTGIRQVSSRRRLHWDALCRARRWLPPASREWQDSPSLGGQPAESPGLGAAD